MISRSLLNKYYPGKAKDGTKIFYDWVRLHVGPNTTMLNLGAGPPTKNPTRIFKNEIETVVGADIDPIVLENTEMDKAVVIENGVVPLEGNKFDVIVSDFVLEHVENPDQFMAEVKRLLKPGGHFFFRTPNRYHYVALGASLTPHFIHKLIVNKMRGLPEETHDPWKVQYKLNTVNRLRKYARKLEFSDVDLRMVECEPSYLVFNPIFFMIGVGYERFVNRYESAAGIRASIFGKMTRAKLL